MIIETVNRERLRKHETARHAERGTTQRVRRSEHSDVIIDTVNRERLRKHETARHAERGTQLVRCFEHSDVISETVNRERLRSTRLPGTLSGGRSVSVVLNTVM